MDWKSIGLGAISPIAGIANWIGKDKLLGGMAASTDPSKYQVPLAHQGQMEDLINRGVNRVESRPAPQLNMGPQDQFRAMQMQQAQQLQNIAAGQQKGAGELAAERQMQNAAAAQHALASMRGAGGAGSLAAARQLGAVGSTAAGMGRQAALQDQMQAQGMLGQVVGQGRGQDIGVAGQNAQLQQNQMGMNDQAYAQFLQSLLGMDQAALQAQIGAMTAATQKPGLLGPLLSAGGQIGGAAMAASDERLKVNIVPAGDKVDAMLREMRPFEYSYKDEAKYGQGPRVGIMAQHMGRSEMGRETLGSLPSGHLGVDVVKGLSAALASAARLDERLRRVEDTHTPRVPGAMVDRATVGGR